MKNDSGIGVFDSGVGGLSVVKEIRKLLPGENIDYFADTLHMPYGPRPLAEVRAFALGIAGRMLADGAKAVVVACNTASAAALAALREAYPGEIFVGMVPAIKPAALSSGTRAVGVLATEATFQGELFAGVVEEFSGGAEVICQACPGLAEFIEQYDPASGDSGAFAKLRAMLEGFIRPLVARNVDQLVLGCTHYALVKGEIAAAAGEGVAVVDPAPAIAKRLRAVLAEQGLLSARERGEIRYAASGDEGEFLRAAAVHMRGIS